MGKIEDEPTPEVGTPECFGATLQETRKVYGVADYAWAAVIGKEPKEYSEVEVGLRGIPPEEEPDKWIGAWRIHDDLADNLRMAAGYPFKTSAFGVDLSTGKWRNMVAGAMAGLIEENRQMGFIERTTVLYGDGFKGVVSYLVDKILFRRK